MAIINLGQLQEPHESDASAALRSFKTVADIATGVGNLQARQGELSRSIANSEITKQKMNIENVKQTHERFSLYWNGLDDNTKQVFQTSDQYKELQKFFKGFKDIAPGMLDDQGNIVPSSNKEIFSDKLKEATAQAKLNVSSGKGTQTDINLIRLDKLGGTDTMAEALNDLEDAIKRKEIEANDPEAAKGFIQRWWEKFTAKKKAVEDIEAGVNPNALAPTGANTSDPLGLLGG